MVTAIAGEENGEFCVAVPYEQDCWYNDPVGKALLLNSANPLGLTLAERG